jgi:hypothetical protein
MSEDFKKTAQTIVNRAVEWLLKQQSKDGWQGDIRATSCALQALISSGFGTGERSVELGCNYLCIKQAAETGAWCQNDGDTAEALRTLIMCGKTCQDKAIEDGINALNNLKSQGEVVIRSEAGWIHPNLVARAFVSLGQNPAELLKSLSPFLDGTATFDTKYTSRAVLVYKEARINDETLIKKAEAFLRKSANNITVLNGEYIGLLIQALVALGYKFQDGIIQNVVTYLQKIQQDNGSWEDNVKATSQIIIGLANAGFRYKKPPFFTGKNIARISIMAVLFTVAIVLWYSPVQTTSTYIVNIVGLFLGLIIIIEWIYPKIKLRV